jgi:hypothetical protein
MYCKVIQLLLHEVQTLWTPLQIFPEHLVRHSSSRTNTPTGGSSRRDVPPHKTTTPLLSVIASLVSQREWRVTTGKRREIESRLSWTLNYVVPYLSTLYRSLSDLKSVMAMLARAMSLIPPTHGASLGIVLKAGLRSVAVRSSAQGSLCAGAAVHRSAVHGTGLLFQDRSLETGAGAAISLQQSRCAHTFRLVSRMGCLETGPSTTGMSLFRGAAVTTRSPLASVTGSNPAVGLRGQIRTKTFGETISPPRRVRYLIDG